MGQTPDDIVHDIEEARQRLSVDLNRLEDRAKQALAVLESGKTSIVAGKPDESELIRRVMAVDADERMPSKGPPLDAQEAAVVHAVEQVGGRARRAAPGIGDLAMGEEFFDFARVHLPTLADEVEQRPGLAFAQRLTFV